MKTVAAGGVVVRDLGVWDTNDVDLDYELDMAATRLDALMTALVELQPQARVILAQLPPINDAAEDARCVTYNQAIVATVQAHHDQGEAVTTVDLHSAITTAELADKLHPNDVGYAKVALCFTEVGGAGNEQRRPYVASR